jgi:hypothetical protein
MAHPAETRAHVRRLYIEGLPLSGAATTVKVSYETAREWKRQSAKNGDDWDTARAAYKVSEQGIDALNKQLVEDFSRQVITTTRELETARIEAVDKARLLSQLADAYAKFSRAFSRVNPAYSGLSVALDTLKTLADYLAENDRAALKILQEHLDAVGALLGKRYA